MGKGQKACVMSGIYCAQVACTDDILVGLDSAGECLCVEQTACLALNFADVKKPVGMIPQDGFFCKLGLFCCTYGCKKPSVLCAGSGKACCIVEQAAFLLAEPYIPWRACVSGRGGAAPVRVTANFDRLFLLFSGARSSRVLPLSRY